MDALKSAPSFLMDTGVPDVLRSPLHCSAGTNPPSVFMITTTSTYISPDTALLPLPECSLVCGRDLWKNNGPRSQTVT